MALDSYEDIKYDNTGPRYYLFKITKVLDVQEEHCSESQALTEPDCFFPNM